MNQENSNSDKIRHSDEDYHEITIDWSNESFDYRKQLFHQLSAYTGVLNEQQECVKVDNVNGKHSLVNLEFRNGMLVELSLALRFDTKESAMKYFQDGDCFLIETIMNVNGWGYGISCKHRLVHRDLANESGCNPEYCQYLGRRSFTRKISEIIKAEYSQPILDPMDRQARRERNTVRENLHFDHYQEMKSMADAHSVPDCKLKLFLKTEEDRKKAREMAGSEFDQ
uniref:Uncharacterized protein n=1 Tax=Tetranychus urticae TaxID=32264 RepID=T1KWZ2_TETUR